jgi:hypothetical protein
MKYEIYTLIILHSFLDRTLITAQTPTYAFCSTTPTPSISTTTNTDLQALQGQACKFSPGCIEAAESSNDPKAAAACLLNNSINAICSTFWFYCRWFVYIDSRYDRFISRLGYLVLSSNLIIIYACNVLLGTCSSNILFYFPNLTIATVDIFDINT